MLREEAMHIRRRIMELCRQKPADDRERDTIQRELIAIFQSLPIPDAEVEGRDVATRLRDTCYEVLVKHSSSLTARYTRKYRDDPGVTSAVHEAFYGAVKRFNPDFENPFAVFADRTIRGTVARYFRDDLIKDTRVQRRLHDEAMEIRKLQQELGDDDVCRVLNISPEHMAEVLGIATRPRGLVRGEDVKAAERILGERSATPEARSDRMLDQSYQELLQIFEPLTERHRLTLKHRFGIVKGDDGRFYHDRWFDQRSQAEIADMTGFTQTHVSRTMRSIQNVLKRAVTDD